MSECSNYHRFWTICNTKHKIFLPFFLPLSFCKTKIWLSIGFKHKFEINWKRIQSERVNPRIRFRRLLILALIWRSKDKPVLKIKPQALSAGEFCWFPMSSWQMRQNGKSKVKRFKSNSLVIKKKNSRIHKYIGNYCNLQMWV